MASADGSPLPPPGWYPDPYGQPRWWDGTAWGAAAPTGPSGPPGSSPSNTRTLAVLSHLGFLFGGFLLPLVIYLTADRGDRFLRHHASEALNFQLTFMVAWLGGFAVMFGVVFGGIGLASGSGDSAGGAVVAIGFVLMWVLLLGAVAVSWGFGILGAMRANQGRWWRYPVCIRLVPGAADPDEVGWG